MTDAVTRHNQGVYDLIASGYNERQVCRADQSQWPCDLSGAFLARLPPAARVADLGCGPAHDGRWLAGAGHRVIGLDRSAGMLAIARQSLPGQVAQADLRHLPLADGSLDGAWCRAALLHVPQGDTAATMAEFRRVLRDGGILALTTAAGDRTFLEPVPFAPDQQRWFIYRQPAELRDQLAAADFQVLALTVEITHRDWVKILAVAGQPGTRSGYFVKPGQCGSQVRVPALSDDPAEHRLIRGGEVAQRGDESSDAGPHDGQELFRRPVPSVSVQEPAQPGRSGPEVGEPFSLHHVPGVQRNPAERRVGQVPLRCDRPGHVPVEEPR
jgi:SAM-dependent methyltransferase